MKFRDFIVTVTPRIESYADRQYELEVTAESHSKAISRARTARFNEEGRFAVPCDYRAKLKAPHSRS